MRRHSDADRGASLVEYALAVALILVVSMVAIKRLETNERSKLSSRASGIGTPNEDTRVRGGSGTGGGSGGSPGGGSASATVSFPPTMDGSTAVESNSKWLATIAIQVLDDSGNPVAGATVSGDWNPDTNSETATCITSSAGSCTVTISSINQNVSGVSYKLTSVTGSSNLTVNYSGGQPTLALSRPSSCC